MGVHGTSSRTVGRIEVRIDRNLCVGFGDCVSAAPDAFALDEEGTAILVSPESTDRASLLEACASCPVDAITALDDEGGQLVP